MARRRTRGTGSVFYDHHERCWVAIYPLGIVNGRRTRKKARAATEQAARAELERLHRIYGAGGTPANSTLDAYLDEWLTGHARSIRSSTQRSYRDHIALHISPLLGGIPLSKLMPADVRRLMAELERKGLKPATVVRVVTTLRIALNAAVSDRTISDNPAAHIRLPRVERDPVRPLTAAEADAIVDATAGEWIGPIVRLLLGSGIRLGEATGLNQGDLMLDAGYIRVRISKTSIRAVPISDDAVRALREALAVAPRRGPDEPLFFSPRRRGERLRGSSVSHALPRTLERAGLYRLAPHALRHGAATLMLAEGVPMRLISEQLGHSNPALTSRVYAHVIPEQQRDAVRHLERRKAR